MAVDLKESPTKELLQRSSIRTMKKDLARLREEDSLQEKQKISKIIPTTPPIESNTAFKEAQQPIAVKVPQTNTFPGQQKDELEKFLESSKIKVSVKTVEPELSPELLPKTGENAKQNQDSEVRVKTLATETEKQQLFLLQAQRADLEKQMKAISPDGESSLLLEKNKIFIQKEHWQKKLDAIAQEEEKNEQEQKITQDEPRSNVLSENQKFEKEALTKEEQGQTMEKKRWVIENELKKLEDALKALDQTNGQSEITQQAIKKEIADIDNSLTLLQKNILDRDKVNPPSSPVLAKQDSVNGSQNNLQSRNSQSVAGKEILPEAPGFAEKFNNKSESPKSFVSEPAFTKSSPAAMEKFEKSTQVEQVQRRKFMEDVEKWAASAKTEEEK